MSRVIAPLRAFSLIWIVLLACSFLAQALSAQVGVGYRAVVDATHLHEPIPLGNTWLVHAGDNPEYARTDFDDFHWTPFAPSTSLFSTYGRLRPSIVWYRVRIKVDPADTGLGLSENNISRAFEIYVNGERLIANGQVYPFKPYTFAARLRSPIPDRMTATGSLVIAMRVHISPLEWNKGQDPGFYSTNLMLGQLDDLYREDWLATLGGNLQDWLDDLLMLGLGLIAFVLFSAQRSQKEYLWIVAVSLLTLCDMPLPVISPFMNVPEHWLMVEDLFRLFSPYLWGSLYFSFVRQRLGWGWRTYFIVAGIANALGAMQGTLFQNPLQFQVFTNLPYIILLSVIIPIVLTIHWRRGNREAGILLIPAVLFSLYIYLDIAAVILFQIPAFRQAGIRLSNTINQLPLGPFSFSFNWLSDMLSTLALGVIILLRSSRTSRRQAQLEAELEAAQQVQHLLVPEQVGAIPGFTVESVYLPAQQVGGDFFQVLPSGEGGLLVVVGDVAGKGLPAAMLVSVIVGAIRATAEFTHDPAALLANLNDRLVGRCSGGGFSTALAARIASDGSVTLANAGHLPPYLDGNEIETPGALPLGVTADSTYALTRFQLHAGSRLTFYSDGVVEAQNRQGELFGFERTREASIRPAVAIAESAREFGQQDDITVVTIERVGAAVAIA